MEAKEARINTCPKCGSHHLMTQLKVHPWNESSFTKKIVVEAESPPIGWLPLPSQIEGEVTATVCGDCGYTELYTRDYGKLWEAWSKRNT